MKEEEQQREERAKARPRDEKKEPRVSTTDPEARMRRMADGGYRPASNGQLATDTGSQIVVAVDVTKQGTDHGQVEPMRAQIERRYGVSPGAMLVDGGFVSLADLEAVEQKGCRVYAPAMERPRDPRSRDRRRHRRDTKLLARWRRRMRTVTAKAVYRLRAPTAEGVNALARSRGSSSSAGAAPMQPKAYRASWRSVQPAIPTAWRANILTSPSSTRIPTTVEASGSWLGTGSRRYCRCNSA